LLACPLPPSQRSRRQSAAGFCSSSGSYSDALDFIANLQYLPQFQ